MSFVASTSRARLPSNPILGMNRVQSNNILLSVGNPLKLPHDVRTVEATFYVVLSELFRAMTNFSLGKSCWQSGSSSVPVLQRQNNERTIVILVEVEHRQHRVAEVAASR